MSKTAAKRKGKKGGSFLKKAFNTVVKVAKKAKDINDQAMKNKWLSKGLRYVSAPVGLISPEASMGVNQLANTVESRGYGRVRNMRGGKKIIV
jgi:hypothetical protein